MKCLVVAMTLLAFAYAADIKECSPTADDPGCSDDECCIPEPQFFLFGKRNDLQSLADGHSIVPWGDRKGRCIRYKYEGDVCNTWASLQECGCADGLICKLFVPSDLESPELKRAILPWFIPNSDYACMVDTPAQ
ncbi:hypothetical protein EB796_015178 [Bugula neritina]|uniref:Uncharacterized protein n=1 Tax=Bugula neritina TaxID=10212 RepID=A0A7J7JK63_BUGNE|nr:hypothetical protein EB796_015178 [Bugula neritina]